MEGELDLLLSVAGGVGRWHEVDDLKRVYVKDEDCLACLRDLQRFLRRDDADLREVFFKLGQLQVVENDVVPLIITYPTDKDLVYHALKVLTFMTMPVDEMTAKVPKQYSILADIKRVCISRDVLAALMTLSAGPLSRHPRMSEEDHQMLQLLLTFFRNLVSIPDPPAAAAAVLQTSMQDTLLQALFDENVMDLVLLVASHADERPFRDDAPLLLDLLAEVYQGVNVQGVLDMTTEAVLKHQQQQRAQAAAAARRAAHQKPRSVAQQILAGKQLTRHGRFRSTIVQTHKDTAANTYIHDASRTNNLEAPQIELGTKVREPSAQNWSPQLLLALKSYTLELLKGGHNVLMATLRRELQPGLGTSRLEAADFAKWFRLAAWVCGFVRRQQESEYAAKRQQQQPAAAAAAPETHQETSPFGGISATLGYESFHMTQVVFQSQADLPQRAGTKDWDLLHASAEFLREALGVVELACKAGIDGDKKTANRLARKLLHDTTDYGIFSVLSRRIKTFSVRYEPRSAAAILVEATHVVLRLYDILQAQEDGVFLVKAKKRRGGGGGRRKKMPTPEPQEQQEEGEEEGQRQQQQQRSDPEGQQQQQQQQCEEGAEGDKQHDREPGATDAAAAAASSDRNGVLPAAAAAVEGTRCDAGAADGTPAPATAAAAAAADGDDPGSSKQPKQQQQQRGVSPAFAESAGSAGDQNPTQPQQQQQQQQRPYRVADDPDDDDDSSGSAAAAGTAAAGAAKGGARRNMLEELEAEGGSGSDDEEDDEGGYGVRHREVAFDLKEKLRKEMAVPAVVHFYTWLLAGYSGTNSPALNHAVTSFLWRLILPEHLNLEPILYQLSVLRLFHQFLSDATLRGKKEHTNVLRLATKVVRGLFGKLAPTDPLPDAAGAAGNGSDPAAAAAAADHNLPQQQQEEEEEQQQQQQDKEREARRRDAVSGMMAVELLFWNHPNICDVISHEYYLKEGEVLAGVGGKGKRKDALNDDGRPAPKTLAPLLNPAGEAKLKTFFEQLCADRSNIELLTRKMGNKLSSTHIRKEMKRLGLQFGHLPDSLQQQLHQLWQKYNDEGAATAIDKIAQELPGGWNNKQVRKLLRNEGLLGATRGGGRLGRRRTAADDDEGFISDGDDAGDGADGGDVLFDVEKSELEQLYQQYIVEEDYLDKIAAALPIDAAAADVLATLRFHGIVSKPAAATTKRSAAAAAAGGGRRRAGGPDVRKVTKAVLVDLCEEHGTDGDGLNIIAMSVGLPVIEVQKLMVKFNISTDGDSDPENSTQSTRRCPISPESLKQLYKECKDSGKDWAESIAEQLPIPASAKQVKAWLKMAGILQAATRKRRDTGAAGEEKGGEAPAAAVTGFRIVGSVPEPQPMQLLGYLEALNRAHEDSDRWLDGAGAVSWLLSKLDAAETVWRVAAAAGAALTDYALVPSGADDLDFFCSDWSNEMLVAAGVRNDNGDYFKIPGNSTPAWRDRVRSALRDALSKLGSSEAAAACDAVMEDARSAAAAEAAAAAAAEQEAQKSAAAKGAGFGSSRSNPAAAAGKAAKKGERRRNSTAAAANGSSRKARKKSAAAVESSDDGWETSDDDQQQQQQGAGSSSSSESDLDDDMPRFEGDQSDQDHEDIDLDGRSDDLAAAAASSKKRRRGDAAAGSSSDAQSDQPNHDDLEDDLAVAGTKKRSNVKVASKAAAATGVGSRKQRSSAAADPAAASAGGDKRRKSGSDVEDGAAARRTALQEITKRRQHQQQPLPAPQLLKPQQQQQQRMMDLEDDDSDLADE